MTKPQNPKQFATASLIMGGPGCLELLNFGFGDCFGFRAYSGLQLRATWERTLPACSCRAKAIRETIRQTSRQDACAPRSHPSENRYRISGF
jgi:hypothetical protein